jgi:hypothetical protein
MGRESVLGLLGGPGTSCFGEAWGRSSKLTGVN